jgi:guanylate kinase
MPGSVFLIAGPSGSGKTTLTQELVRRVPGLTKAVTVTTRQPRPGEVPGVDYHFVSTGRFQEMLQGGELIENDFAYNEHYGIPQTALDVAGDIAIIVTVQGALALRRQMENARSIFILPTCLETTAARVAARKCPNEEPRIANYEAEVIAARYFDHVILNLDLSQSVTQIEKIIFALRGPCVVA